MPTLIDRSFFVRDINIPNPNDHTIGPKIDSYIAKYEPDCLLKLFGYPLYKDFVASPSSQRMIDLINGKEYIGFNGLLCKWQGLKHDTNVSLIANYVYYKFQYDEATRSTGVSTAVKRSEGATSVSPKDKMINAWNYLSEEVTDLLTFIRYSNTPVVSAVYPEFTFSQWRCAKNYFDKINFFGI